MCLCVLHESHTTLHSYILLLLRQTVSESEANINLQGSKHQMVNLSLCLLSLLVHCTDPTILALQLLDPTESKTSHKQTLASTTGGIQLILPLLSEILTFHPAPPINTSIRSETKQSAWIQGELELSGGSIHPFKCSKYWP